MRGVGVEEPAAVGAEQLDGFLAGDRTAGDRLLPADQCVDDLVVQREVLDDAAADQNDRGDRGERQQDSDDAAHQIHPEVAEVTGVATGQSAHERHRDSHADGRRDEVLHREACHLHQMALCRLSGVGLPVGVRDEADGRVPRERGSHRSAGVVEVQRQPALHQLEKEQKQHADRGEGQHAAGVGAPGLFGFRVGADQAVDDALTAQVLGRCVDAVHVVAERNVDGREADDQGCEEQDPRGRRTH